MELENVSEELTRLDEKIAKLREVAEQRRGILSGTEHNLSVRKAQLLFKAKYAEKLTDTCAKAKAEMESEVEALEVLRTDSEYRQSKLELDNCLDKRETLKEIAYNIRASMKCFGG